MQMILEFFQYTLSGIWFWIWFFIMITCSLACVGVVGEKESKKKQADMLAKREAAAKEEYKKAQELIEKQANSYSVDRTLDPTAKAQAETQAAVQQPVPEVVQESVVVQEPVVEVQAPPAAEVVVLDAAPSSDGGVVDNVTPIVDNTSEAAVKENDVPAVLVINEDGTSNG